MRKMLLGLLLLLAAVSLHGDVVTLPAAASIVGGSPFYSDVRVFNSSYASSLDVTGTYRCFIATGACPGIAPQIHFTLSPRQSRAFNDICAEAFASPNTAGGVELEFSGSSQQLVVTSRLYSTQPHDSVGMFIPGLEASKAASTTVLTSIRHDPSVSPPSGFRSNVGAFNPGAGSVGISFAIFDAGTAVGSPVTRTVAGHSGVQVSGIFEAAGLASLSTENAVIVVSSSGPVFSYAAVLDNVTTDPIFVVGAPDQTATSAPASRVVHVGRGGTIFVDDQTLTSLTTINVGDTVTWVWEGTTNHGTSAGSCSGGGGGGYGGGYGGGCVGSGLWGSKIHMAPYSYSFKFTQAGTFHYFCDVHQSSMTGQVIVKAKAAAALESPHGMTRYTGS